MPLIVPVAVIVLVAGARTDAGRSDPPWRRTGFPVLPTDVVGPMPRGEVAPSEGVAGHRADLGEGRAQPENEQDETRRSKQLVFIGAFLNRDIGGAGSRGEPIGRRHESGPTGSLTVS